MGNFRYVVILGTCTVTGGKENLSSSNKGKPYAMCSFGGLGRFAIHLGKISVGSG